MSAFQSWEAKLCVADSLPTSPKHLDIISSSLRLSQEFVNANGHKGTRTLAAARMRPGVKRVGGTVTLNPTPVDLAYLLPKILGGTPASTNYPLAEKIGTFQVWEKKGTGSADLHQFAGVGVNRATFTSRGSGAPLELSLDLVAQTRTKANVSSYPAGGIDTTTPWFMAHELGAYLALLGPQNCIQWQLTIDNFIDTERFLNSQTLTAIESQGRLITWRYEFPAGDTQATAHPEILDATGAGVQAVALFSSGTVSLQFDCPTVKFGTLDPVINQAGELVLELVGTATSNTALGEMTTTLDSTP